MSCPQVNNTTILGTSAVTYDSTPLPCTDVNTCDGLNVILAKFDSVICTAANNVNILTEDITNLTEDLMIIIDDVININNQLNICCPTTTTTSSSSTTTTSTTLRPTTTTTSSSSTSTTTSSTSTSTTTTSSSSTSTTTSTSTTIVPTTTTTSTSTSSTTTTTTTECNCVSTVTLDVTEAGTFEFRDCSDVSRSAGVSVGMQTLDYSGDGCITKNTQSGTAMYTILEYGPCCTPV